MQRATPALLAQALIASLMLLAAAPPCAADASPPALVPLLRLESAQRECADGRGPQRIDLPEHVDAAPGANGPLDCRYRLPLGAGRRNAALFLPGLAAWAQVELNGHTLLDSRGDALLPDSHLPEGADRIVLLPIADEDWQPDGNELRIRASGRHGFTLSSIYLGPLPQLRGLHRAHVLGVLVGPALAAAVVGTLGLCMSLLWLRRRDVLYGYFGLGTLCWAAQTIWAVLPEPPLRGIHVPIWWTVLSTFLTLSMVLFCLRFSQWHWPRFTRSLWVCAMLCAPLLYGATLLGVFDGVESLWRLVLIGLAGAGVAAVAWAAWRRPGRDQLLLLLCGLMGLGFAVHDWLTYERAWRENPVYLGPYAGLVFALFVVQLLIGRFVRAEQQLATINLELEERVARQTAQLRRAMEDMRSARDAAEQASEAKTRFLAAASHDMRQPAHALALYVAALKTRPLAAGQAELVQRMDVALLAMDTMFNALLDVSRIDAGALVPIRQTFALEALLRRLADEAAAEADAQGLRLTLRLPPGGLPLRVHSDPALVESILRNLLANALKYTSRGGVLLACRLRHAPTPHWRIEVWDSGLGIAPADCKRVFDEFFQAANGRRQRANGIGLGLSIVQRLARLLDAEIGLRSRLGHGSCFALSLPVTEAALSPAPAPEAGAEAALARSS